MNTLPYKALKKVVEVKKGVSTCTFHCALNKKTFERTLPVDYKEVISWTNGTLIQNAMPDLSADDRELFLTGIEDF